jgi:rare lipoprotein A (peptidoglycan hydrolase)
MLFVSFKIQAQVGEKFYGKASYYADKFHGRSTSSGEPYDREEYTAAHRDLPFNTIVELTNTANNKVAVVKINDRGPFVYTRIIDVSFAAARDLELLGPGEAEIEMKVLSMDKPEYVVSSVQFGPKGEFNKEFNQHAPVKMIMKNGRFVIDTLGTGSKVALPAEVVVQKTQPAAPAFVVSDSAKQAQADGAKMGFAQHKYVRVVKDRDGRFRLDSSMTAPPVPKEIKQPIVEQVLQTVIAQNKQNPPQEQPSNSSTNIVKTNYETATKPEDKSGFTQHKYVRVYLDNEGRVRIDTSQNKPVITAKSSDNKGVSQNIQSATPQRNEVNITAKAPVNSMPQTQNPPKPKEVYKDGVRQHSYIKIYYDANGRIKMDTANYEKPK